MYYDARCKLCIIVCLERRQKTRGAGEDKQNQMQAVSGRLLRQM